MDILEKINWLLKQPWFALPFFVWIIFWKGFSLWKAAGKRQVVWFVLILIVNTMSLLEILYVFYLNQWSLGSEKILSYFKEKSRKK